MKTILIVEDEALIAMDIETKLKNSGYEIVETAFSGEEAIKKVKELKPDLILMDIYLNGDLDGIETAAIINTFRDIPIIYLSAFSDENTFERIKRTNPYGFINKPISNELLLISVKTAIYKHELDKKLVESEEHLRSIFDSSNDCIYSLDADGRFTSANKNTCDKFRLDEDEIIGKTLLEAGFEQKQHNKFFKFFKKALTTDSTASYCSVIPLPNGHISEYEVILNPLHDINGEIIGVSGISIDLTQHKQLKKEFDKIDTKIQEA